MTALLVQLVIALIGTWVLILRAHRDHSDALTKMHGDVAVVLRKLKALEARIDGGTIPK